jgi:hypothetical protein
MSDISKVKDRLFELKMVMGDLERHLDAGGVVKAHDDAERLEDGARKLYNMTYKLAFPDKCPHLNGKTEVMGGGWSCNSCGSFCSPRGYDA